MNEKTADMQAKARTVLLEILKEIRRKVQNRDWPVNGICDTVWGTIPDEYAYLCDRGRVYATLSELMNQWPEHSGNRDFPVPNLEQDPWEAYRCSGPEGKWSGAGPYGAARRRLLDWLIDQLEAESRREPTQQVYPFTWRIES